eukprot:EG_transcript_39038
MQVLCRGSPLTANPGHTPGVALSISLLSGISSFASFHSSQRGANPFQVVYVWLARILLNSRRRTTSMKKGNGNGGDAEVWRRYSAGQWCSTGHVEASVALPVLLVEANSSVRCRAPGLLPSSAHPLAAWQQGGSYLP